METKIFYDWSGGMESSAMLVIDRERIRSTNAVVRWADTGKHFLEMYDSKRQIESLLGLKIETVPQRITFDEYLFGRGGMLRKGMNDCSRRMKRSNLMRHFRTFCRPATKKKPAVPGEVNLGFNNAEDDRADAFIARNERDWCHWRFPLIEHDISRAETVSICKKAGFSVLVGMYEKMGRFDCYFCPNQKREQALKVVDHYPELAAVWSAAEKRKGHSFLRVPLEQVIAERDAVEEKGLFSGCSCFGGEDDVWEDEPEEDIGLALVAAKEKS